MKPETLVALTPKGLAVVKEILSRSLEISCPNCGAQAGRECVEDNVCLDRVRASRPVDVDCPECGAARGIGCFIPGGGICAARREAQEAFAKSGRAR